MMVDLDKSRADAETPDYVDALRLLRLVNLRRVLRALTYLELLALPVWAAYSLALEAVYEDGSPVWQAVDDETGPGFVVILAALVLTLVATAVTTRLGRAGRLAARLVPATGKRPEPALRPNTRGRALRSRLRRAGFVHPGAVTLFLFAAVLAVMSVGSFWPAWRANHGHGDAVFVVDADTTVYREAPRGSVRGDSDTWFVYTPEGRAVAESGRPRVGERWAVTTDLFDNAAAYRVGGTDYVLVGAFALAATVTAAGALGWQAQVVREERRRRRSARRRSEGEDLAGDIAELAAGHRPRLLFNGAEVATLGVPASAGDDPARLLWRRRAVATVAGTVLAGTAITLIVTSQLTLLG